MSCVTWCDYAGTIPTKTDDTSSLAIWEIELSTFSNWFRNEILGMFEGETPTFVTTYYIAAHSTVCTAALPGTELLGDGYARYPVTFERVSDIKRWNPNAVNSPIATAEWSVASLSIWDALSGGNYYAFGNFTETLTVEATKAIAHEANSILIGMGSPP